MEALISHLLLKQTLFV